MHDIIIIGAGPAGLSAAIYAARKALKTLILSQNIGGQGIDARFVENYLGFPGITGIELIEKFLGHAKSLGIEVKEGMLVEKINKKDGIFEVIASERKFEAKAVIVSTGKKYRELGIPGAREFEGKGISYCATCDAPLFKDKTVAVIGAGDAGLDAAWLLASYASKIYIVNKYPELRGHNKDLEERIKEDKKIELFNNFLPGEIKGDKFANKLVIQEVDSGEKKELEVQGIFVEIGSIPASEILKEFTQINQKGEIIVDHETNMTSTPGIFAAGDVSDVKYKQMIIAAAEGAKAALAAYDYLRK
ncbi:MAG: hypothetical protein UV40_C0024G0002 [Parcubacteria group bacterium GW2011_GWA1_42_7]|nr:MAG: hypothetical protein UV34_C0025G0003 [Parcubacteria group bacterium GW2011_GWB1_42_6]KKS69400.1 MAG: hypothetical protein UV40_C0024G0002 [Parcubacteria group bacterium GW2011_GWA1_42_7]